MSSLKKICLVGLWKIVTPIFLSVCLGVAVYLIYKLKDELGMIESIDLISLLKALGVQGLVSMTVVISWKRNLALHGVEGVSLAESAAHVGINGLGKYIPGKIAGSILRGGAVYHKTGDIQSAVMASFIEQIAVIHSGIVIAMTIYVYNYYGAFAGSAVFLVSTLSLLLVNYFERINNWALIRLHRSTISIKEVDRLENIWRYSNIYFLFSVVWFLSAITVYYCMASFYVASNFDFFDVLFITVFAYISGFIALFAPGGIGVREGIMVSMLMPVTGLPTAISISVMQRIITVIYDVILGAFSLMHGGKLINNSKRQDRILNGHQ